MFNVKHKISKRIHPWPNIKYDFRRSLKGLRKKKYATAFDSPPIDCKGADHLHNYMTLACNLNCSYCINRQVVDEFPTFERHDWIKWAHFLNRLWNIRQLYFNGGEHFLLPYFADVINRLHHHNIFIFSNYPKSAVLQMQKLKRGTNNIFIDFAFNPYEDDPVNVYISRLNEVPKGINFNVHVINTPKTDTRSIVQRFQRAGIYATVGDVIWYPELRYAKTKDVLCRSNEHVLGPDMRFYDCFVKMLYEDEGTAADDYEWHLIYKSCPIYPRCLINCSFQDVQYVDNFVTKSDEMNISNCIIHEDCTC